MFRLFIWQVSSFGITFLSQIIRAATYLISSSPIGLFEPIVNETEINFVLLSLSLYTPIVYVNTFGSTERWIKEKELIDFMRSWLFCNQGAEISRDEIVN